MLDNINKYLQVTGGFLGVGEERYGGGYRAIICHQDNVDWLAGLLTGDDNDAVQTQFFLADNPAFPACWGETPSESLEKLDGKLCLLYDFIPVPDRVNTWECRPRFTMKAQYDTDPREPIEHYEVGWNQVVEDLVMAYRKDSFYFYSCAKDEAGPTTYRDLNALINITLSEEMLAKLSNLF